MLIQSNIEILPFLTLPLEKIVGNVKCLAMIEHEIVENIQTESSMRAKDEEKTNIFTSIKCAIDCAKY